MVKQMASQLMKAVQYSSYGGEAAALQKVDIPIPAPKEGELLVKLEAVGLNPYDCRCQKGLFRPIFPQTLPCTPGTRMKKQTSYLKLVYNRIWATGS